MARRRSKKARHGRRKRRLSAKQRRAMMRNLRKARKALRGKKRRKGGKKRRKSRGRKKSRRRSSKRRSRRSGSRRSGGLSFKAAQVYQTLINRGRTPQQAHKVAARIDRMRTGRVKRYFEREAMQAKSASQLSNLFAGFGAAGHLAKQAG